MSDQLKYYLLYFLTGGTATALIIWLERSGNWLFSGFATLMPVFTVVTWLFIGGKQDGAVVSRLAWFVLYGTLFSWVPYIIAVAILAPKVGPHKAIPIGLGIFLVFALAYMQIVRQYQLFQ